MNVLWSLIFSFLASTTTPMSSGAKAHAPDLPARIFLARVESDALYPNKPGEVYGCPSDFSTSASSKLDTICVSNSCGKDLVTFSIVKNLYGKNDPPKTVTLTSGLGEWCKPRVPLGAQQPLLVVLFDVNGKEDRYEFVELDKAKDGTLFFLPDESGTFGGIDVLTLISSIAATDISPMTPTDVNLRVADFYKKNKTGCMIGSTMGICGGVKVDDYVARMKQQAKQ